MFLYIDATAGGLFIQVLLGGFAGIGFVGRLIWSRVSRRSHEDGDAISAESSTGANSDDEERAA